MDGVERLPYRLPQLLERKAKGHTLFVVEGEKDADAPMIVAVAAIVGRTVDIRPRRRDDWLVVPNCGAELWRARDT